jgi:hypothetical protein
MSDHISIQQKCIRNSDMVKNIFDELCGFNFTKYCTYCNEKQILLPLYQNKSEDNKNDDNDCTHDFSIYLPKSYTDFNSRPDKCLCITNGQTGIAQFFNDLCHDLIHHGFMKNTWSTHKFEINHNDLFVPSSFVGLQSPDKKTFIGMGSYEEFFSGLPRESQYNGCSYGLKYYMHLNDLTNDCYNKRIEEWIFVEQNGVYLESNSYCKGSELRKYIGDVCK